jgi:outer membrane protein assembly factor BamB
MHVRTPMFLTVLLAVAFLSAPWPVVSTQAGADWPQWRGVDRDGLSRETGLLQAWPAQGPPLAWRASGAGEGYSSFSTANGRLFTMGARGADEFVVAFDAGTGTRLWETRHGRRFRNDRGDGPRGTPTVDGDRVYAFGGSGDLACLDVQSGRIIWSLNVMDRFRGRTPRWGYSESPLVLADRVLINAGGPDASIVALNKKDGSVLWTSQSDGAAYSSAVPMRIGDTTSAVFFTGRRALGLDVQDGRLLWDYSPVANQVANIATPIVHGSHVFVSSDYGTGAALLDVRPAARGGQASEVYFSRRMRNHHSSAVLVGDHLYGYSSAILTAMRFADGEVAWRDRSVGKGSVIHADGRLYLYSEGGVVGLAEVTPAGYRETGRFSLPRGSLPTWSHPIVSHGRLYLRDQDTIYVYDIRSR